MPQRKESGEILRLMERKLMELTRKNTEVQELHEAWADAERNFNIEYAKKLLLLRSESEPVTLVKDLAKGDKFVADLYFKMRVAEGVRNACRGSIRTLLSAIDKLRSELSYLKQEMGMTK